MISQLYFGAVSVERCLDGALAVSCSFLGDLSVMSCSRHATAFRCGVSVATLALDYQALIHWARRAGPQIAFRSEDALAASQRRVTAKTRTALQCRSLAAS